MLIRVADIEVQTRHVELPDRCPKCGEPTERLNEINLAESFLDGVVSSDEPPDQPERLGEFNPDPDATWTAGDLYVVTGYRCGKCHAALAVGTYSEIDVE